MVDDDDPDTLTVTAIEGGPFDPWWQMKTASRESDRPINVPTVGGA
jgi:hypothetical protein